MYANLAGRGACNEKSNANDSQLQSDNDSRCVSERVNEAPTDR